MSDDSKESCPRFRDVGLNSKQDSYYYRTQYTFILDEKIKLELMRSMVQQSLASDWNLVESHI